MPTYRHPFAVVLAAAGCASMMLSAPLSAAELPHFAGAPSAYDSAAENAWNHRWRPYRHRDRIDAGDIFAGVLVLGAVAAIADAASDSNRSRDRDRYRERPVQYREPAARTRSWGQGGIGNAVDLCVAEVERGQDRVASVDNAARDAGGWAVSGSLDGGDYFSCRLDNEGRIRSIDLGDGFAAGDAGRAVAAADLDPSRQLSDEAYARARAATRSQGAAATAASSGAVDADLDNGPRPAYPGGPLPGEDGYEEAVGG